MKISGRTRLLGLMGWPVEHTFSPAMHNAAAEALGLDVVYVALPVRPEALAAAVRGLGALGFLGVNVTVPHKEAVIPFLDEVAPAARAIGAVNTIQVAAGREGAARLVGHNTDAAGFMMDLAEGVAGDGVTVAGRHCLVLGAGGAARAVAYGLAEAGGRVQVLARRREQAERLVGDLRRFLPGAALRARPWKALEGAAEEAGASSTAEGPLIVNATPVGMEPNVEGCPWPEGVGFPAGAFVYDLVYNPRETVLVRRARAAGCGAAGGLGMLLYQGALAFEIWTGVRPEAEVMAAALEDVGGFHEGV